MVVIFLYRLQSYEKNTTFARYYGKKQKYMSNFWQRTLSGIVYVTLVVASILVHPAFFVLLFMVITGLAVNEYHLLTHGHSALRSCAIGSAIMLFGASYFYFTASAIPGWMVGGFVFLSMTAMLLELFRTPTAPIQNWGNFWVSLMMIALPFILMNGILLYNKYVLLALFITIWINDSGAYCVGSLMSKRSGGNHKMFPRVSPGKSWEGLIGGILFALLAGVVFYFVGWTDNMQITPYPLIDSLLFAFVVAIFGTLGDLMESLLKRTIGVKDSGRFMPGHGGVLDRFDSLLLATPAVYFFFIYLPTLF